jgi:hypothetical protein
MRKTATEGIDTAAAFDRFQAQSTEGLRTWGQEAGGQTNKKYKRTLQSTVNITPSKIKYFTD